MVSGLPGLALPVAEKLDGGSHYGNDGKRLLKIGTKTLGPDGGHSGHARQTNFTGASCVLAAGFDFAATALLGRCLFNGNGLGLHENPPE